MRKTTIAVAFLVAWAFAVPHGWAQKYDDPEHAELAKALKDVKLPLQKGLSASTREGRATSAKYEVDHDKLQLPIYTMNGAKFAAVIDDHTTGNVAKTEPMTSS